MWINRCEFDNFVCINASVRCVLVSKSTKYSKLLSNLHQYKQFWQKNATVFLPVKSGTFASPYLFVLVNKEYLGMLTIHLKQEDCDCLSAWVSARETGLAPDDALEQEYINASILNIPLDIKTFTTLTSRDGWVGGKSTLNFRF